MKKKIPRGAWTSEERHMARFVAGNLVVAGEARKTNSLAERAAKILLEQPLQDLTRKQKEELKEIALAAAETAAGTKHAVVMMPRDLLRWNPADPGNLKALALTVRTILAAQEQLAAIADDARGVRESSLGPAPRGPPAPVPLTAWLDAADSMIEMGQDPDRIAELAREVGALPAAGTSAKRHDQRRRVVEALAGRPRKAQVAQLRAAVELRQSISVRPSWQKIGNEEHKEPRRRSGSRRTSTHRPRR